MTEHKTPYESKKKSAEEKRMSVIELFEVLNNAKDAAPDAIVYFDSEANHFNCHMVSLESAYLESAECSPNNKPFLALHYGPGQVSFECEQRQSRVVGDDYDDDEIQRIAEKEGYLDGYQTLFIAGFRKAQSLNTIRAIEDVWSSENEIKLEADRLNKESKTHCCVEMSDWLLSEIKQRLGQG